MTVEALSQNVITEPFQIVELTLPSGVLRLSTCLGGCIAMGIEWPAQDDVWGHIISASGWSEKGDEIANRDVSFVYTPALMTNILYGAQRFWPVKIWQAQRDPETGVVAVEANPWTGSCDMPKVKGRTISMTFVSENARAKAPRGRGRASQSDRSRRIANDTAFRFTQNDKRDVFSNTTTEKPTAPRIDFDNSNWSER